MKFSPVTAQALDLIESSIISHPSNTTEIYLNKIYQFILDHRDSLGLPKGTTTFPYLFVSNDLFGKMSGLVELVQKNKESMDPILKNDEYKNYLQELVQLLIETYDDDKKHQGLWHSQPKNIAQQMFDLLQAGSL